MNPGVCKKYKRIQGKDVSVYSKIRMFTTSQTCEKMSLVLIDIWKDLSNIGLKSVEKRETPITVA